MSTPPPESDDPRLTAYALGEADAAERQAIEQLLAESADARAEVEQTRAFARALAAGYAREHEAYLASQGAVALPANVVAFPAPRDRRWRRMVRPLWQVAAALVFIALAAYPALRNARRPGAGTVASAPTGPAGRAAATPPGTREEPGKDLDLKTRNAPDPQPMARLAPPPAATPGISPVETPTTGTVPLLASGRGRETESAVGQAASRARAVAPAAAAPAAPPAASRRADASRPLDATVAGVSPTGPAAPDEFLARSVVRVRSPDGMLSVGVIMSSDGLILSSLPALESTAQARCTVRLADGRELPATVQPAAFGANRYWLRIDASALPAATLATAMPAAGTPVTFALVDPVSGTVVFPRVRRAGSDNRSQRASAGVEGAPATASESSFAFNGAGELLLVESPAAETKLTAAKTARSLSTSPTAVVRPFTPAEREVLLRAIRREPSE